MPAVVDKAKGEVVAKWPIKEAQQNAPVAFDEKTHRLFVVTRKPGMLIVVNSDTGATVASFKAPERTDQVVWDAANRRVYVTGGRAYKRKAGGNDLEAFDNDAAKPYSWALAHDVRRVDAILFTHSHADHIFGLDDVRRLLRGPRHRRAVCCGVAHEGEAAVVRDVQPFVRVGGPGVGVVATCH